MSIKRIVLVAASAAFGLGGSTLHAQSPSQGLSGDRNNVAERALALREHLELSDEQIQSLDQFRQELLEQRITAMGELMRIRSEVAAGQMTRADAREEMTARRDEARDERSARAERLGAILSEDQLEQLRDSQRRSRRGRARMRGSRGDRDSGLRGPRRSMRGSF